VSDASLQKLASAVHFVIAEADGQELGRTKLNKILWFADCAAWRLHGRTVTGLENYIKLQYGPVPPRMDAAISALVRDGAVRTDPHYVGSYVRHGYLACRTPNPNELGAEERKLLQEIVAAVRPMTAFDVSELSHDALWHATPYGKAISVAAAAVQFTPPDERIREWARSYRH
jgi:hypothetical protein